jgi:probable F420-dependent oxidoreductase
MGERAFRFGFQMRGADAAGVRDEARRAEEAGFDLFHSWDHVVDGWGPLAPLLAAADATTRLRICPLVINNDFHHPVHLAREVSSMDHLTDGRIELGIGAGHSFTEYEQIGQPFDPPAVRKARLRESVEILRRLFDGEEVDFDGEHYRLRRAKIMKSLQERLPMLVGVAGEAALAHAARHADTIGLMGLGKTLPDGHQHEVRWEAERMDNTVAFIRDRSAGRIAPLELNALVQIVTVTDDRRAAAEELATEIPTLAVEDALTTPFLALGTHDEIAAHLLECRRRWGITNFSVRTIDDFQPVIERLRAADARTV